MKLIWGYVRQILHCALRLHRPMQVYWYHSFADGKVYGKILFCECGKVFHTCD